MQRWSELRLIRYGLLCLFLALSSACSSILRNPVPKDSHLEATILGRDDLRMWGDRQALQVITEAGEGGVEALQARFSGIMHREHHYLAISGGGANGAYGAGVLAGWSATGTRPEFTMVTGVSTGALTAPFAFLGSDYDQQLKEVYTTLDTSRIFTKRSLFSMIRGDSIVDSTPLSNMLARYVTDELITAIAREYRRGRSLHVATTNLDAGRSVIWNIGRIADSGHPDAPSLIRQVLLASASIPGIFPPAYIRVQAPDGRIYDEMHVDGGTSSQMFLYPSRTDWGALMEILDVRGTPTAYLIRNSRFVPNYDPVRARLGDIAGRSVNSLIRTQGIGDTYRIAAIAQRDGVAVKLTWIPADAIPDPGEEVFDPEYMTALFEFGYQRSIKNGVWREVDVSSMGVMKVD